MEMEVNGVKYEQIEKKSSKISSRMSSMLLMASMFGGLVDGYGSKERKRPSVDLVSEYGLIQQKKSKLSKSDRDWVECQFERNFKKI